MRRNRDTDTIGTAVFAVQGVLAGNASTPSSCPLWVQRVYATGSMPFTLLAGVSVDTWAPTGYVCPLEVVETGGPVPIPIPLTVQTTQGFCSMFRPRAAVMVSDTDVVVVGQAAVRPVGDDPSVPITAYPQHPSVALVTMERLVGGACTGTTVHIQVGNGPTELPEEEYTDVHVLGRDACGNVMSLAVCGGAVLDGARIATYRQLDQAASYLPVPLGGTTLTYSTWNPPSSSTFTPVLAVSLAVNAAAAMVVVAVNAVGPAPDNEPGTALWCLGLNGLTLDLPPGALGYNDPVMGVVRLAPGATGVTPVRLLVLNGFTILLGNAIGSTANGSGVPLAYVSLYVFDGSTRPLASFGVEGIASWWTSGCAVSYPTDMVVREPFPGGLPVVTLAGNAFVTSAVNGTIWPFPVTFPQALGFQGLGSFQTVPPYTVAAPPIPFVVRADIASGHVIGNITTLLRPLCGAGFGWTVGLGAVRPGSRTVVLYGDFGTKPFAPGQPALVFAATTRVCGCPVQADVRLARDCSTCCNGVRTYTDPATASSAAVLDGTLTVGDATSPCTIPGTIRFTNGAFWGYNGTEWVQFQTM